jgi:hypothetical protein
MVVVVTTARSRPHGTGSSPRWRPFHQASSSTTAVSSSTVTVCGGVVLEVAATVWRSLCGEICGGGTVVAAASSGPDLWVFWIFFVLLKTVC